MMNPGKIKHEFKSCYSIAGLLVATFFFASLYLSHYYDAGGNVDQIISLRNHVPIEDEHIEVQNLHDEEKEGEEGEVIKGCNVFSGKWVYDDEESYPFYKEGECSFLGKDKDFSCEIYGRNDLKYQNWRWQPHHCDLPRFNGTAFLEKIRGKKVIFVGDSLNRNQFISMLCLIESSLPLSSNKVVTMSGNILIFETMDYNATIAFYWSPYLVESNSDNPYVHLLGDRIIGVKSIEKHAKQWNDADILIFNSFAWWNVPKMTLMWGSFGSSEAVYQKVEMKLRRYEMALNTWSDWLEVNINRTKTKMFFMSLSPYHDNIDNKHNCYNESEPISDEGYWGITTDGSMMRVVESTLKKLRTRGVKIEYLNITQMSDYRKDAHTTIYKKYFTPMTEEQLRNPRDNSDCVHWCLPGVPDFWNQILYAYIMNS